MVEHKTLSGSYNSQKFTTFKHFWKTKEEDFLLMFVRLIFHFLQVEVEVFLQRFRFRKISIQSNSLRRRPVLMYNLFQDIKAHKDFWMYDQIEMDNNKLVQYSFFCFDLDWGIWLLINGGVGQVITQKTRVLQIMLEFLSCFISIISSNLI